MLFLVFGFLFSVKEPLAKCSREAKPAMGRGKPCSRKLLF
jgi:hypothetical protein